MKMLKYRVQGYTSVYNAETDAVEAKSSFYTAEKAYSEANEEIAKREAYNGEYTIEDDVVAEDTAPTQMDRIEAQVTYTAMMTDTLLEV